MCLSVWRGWKERWRRGAELEVWRAGFSLRLYYAAQGIARVPLPERERILSDRLAARPVKRMT
jgi:hypothetical protein